MAPFNMPGSSWNMHPTASLLDWATDGERARIEAHRLAVVAGFYSDQLRPGEPEHIANFDWPPDRATDASVESPADLSKINASDQAWLDSITGPLA